MYEEVLVPRYTETCSTIQSVMVNTAADTGYFESVDQSFREEDGDKGGKYAVPQVIILHIST